MDAAVEITGPPPNTSWLRSSARNARRVGEDWARNRAPHEPCLRLGEGFAVYEH